MGAVPGRSTQSLGVMDSDAIRKVIAEGGAEIERLRAKIDETLRRRGESKRYHDEWAAACEAFHARYDGLAFPGGYDRARERIDAGDPEAIEAAVCFLEMRPYFFRSGYMFKDLLRRAKRAALSDAQRARLNSVLEKQAEWRERKEHDA
jgi:hypothetical protein